MKRGPTDRTYYIHSLREMEEGSVDMNVRPQPSMRAKELRPGDVFRVEHPDPESPVRVCLTNDSRAGLRFGWPGKPGYWCYMGEEVTVWLERRR